MAAVGARALVDRALLLRPACSLALYTSALLWRDGWAQWRGVAEALPELNQPTPTAPGPIISISTEDSPLPSTELAASKAVGEPGPGAVRSQRKGRRMLIFALLVAISVLLVVALVFVIAKSS